MVFQLYIGIVTEYNVKIILHYFLQILLCCIIFFLLFGIYVVFVRLEHHFTDTNIGPENMYGIIYPKSLYDNKSLLNSSHFDVCWFL